MITLLDEIRNFCSTPDRDSAVGASLVSRASRRDRSFVKLALRAAGVVGELPKLKSDCCELLKQTLSKGNGHV